MTDPRKLPEMGDYLRRRRCRYTRGTFEEYWERFQPLAVDGMNVLAPTEDGKPLWVNEQQWQFDSPAGAN